MYTFSRKYLSEPASVLPGENILIRTFGFSHEGHCSLAYKTCCGTSNEDSIRINRVKDKNH